MNKFLLKSKTVQGIIITLLPMLSNLLGFEWSASAQVEAAGFLQQIQGNLESIVALVGAGWAFYGRMRADKPLTIKVGG